MATEDDLAYYRGFGWGEEWARAEAVDRQHRRLIGEWEADHQTSLALPEVPTPVRVDLARTYEEAMGDD
jgi:hypothetical protein